MTKQYKTYWVTLLKAYIRGHIKLSCSWKYLTSIPSSHLWEINAPTEAYFESINFNNLQ